MTLSNRDVVETWFEQVWNEGDEATIDRLMSPATKFHGLPGGPIVGPEAFKPFFQTFRQAFPDIRVRVLHTVCEGDLVACHCGVTGTHSGPGLGEPTGSRIDIDGMALAVVRDGQLQEGWNSFDFLALYQQIGLLPPLPG